MSPVNREHIRSKTVPVANPDQLHDNEEEISLSQNEFMI